MMSRLSSALLWFGLGALAWFFFVHRGAGRAEEALAWPRHEATVVTSRVFMPAADSGYELHFSFTIAFGDEIRHYEHAVVRGKKPRLQELAATTHAPGAKHTVHVNPEDRTAFALRPEPGRQRWVGYGAAAFFSLVGLATLFRPEKQAAPAGSNLD